MTLEDSVYCLTNQLMKSAKMTIYGHCKICNISGTDVTIMYSTNSYKVGGDYFKSSTQKKDAIFIKCLYFLDFKLYEALSNIRFKCKLLI